MSLYKNIAVSQNWSSGQKSQETPVQRYNKTCIVPACGQKGMIM